MKNNTRNPIKKLEVAAVFQNHPAGVRKRLMALRTLIYTTATATPGVGEIEETLKWGQPSYLTPKSKSGTTIRLDYDPASDDGPACAFYFHCQTNLVPTFRQLYGKAGDSRLTFEGNRCMKVPLKGKLPVQEIKHCLELALTYHLRKKSAAKTK